LLDCLTDATFHVTTLFLIFPFLQYTTHPRFRPPTIVKMARKRAIAPLKKTAMTPQQSNPAASAEETPTQRYSTRSTRGTAAQTPVYTEPESSDDEDYQPATTKKKAKTSAQPEQDQPTEGPPETRYNTRYKQAQLSEQSQGADDVEEIPRGDEYPLYKDDLPNAFNGAVDPSLDFISKAPNEVIDNILSYLVLDHQPDRGVKMKAGTYKLVPHVLLSMAAMSRYFYHATEGFARRYRTRNKLDLPEPGIYWPQQPEVFARLMGFREKELDKERNKRRSVRIANTVKPETHEVYRKKLCDQSKVHCVVCHLPGWRPGKLANQVTVCEGCERSVFGTIMVSGTACGAELFTDYNALESHRCPEAIRPPRLYVDQVTQARPQSQVPGFASHFIRLRTQTDGLPHLQHSHCVLFSPQRCRDDRESSPW
jgi:hypothetical protein